MRLLFTLVLIALILVGFGALVAALINLLLSAFHSDVHLAWGHGVAIVMLYGIFGGNVKVAK